MTRSGIYVVENPAAEDRPRAVVIATSAQTACEVASRTFGASADSLNVGRLGAYDPGIQGASFMVDGSRPADVVACEVAS